MKHNPFKPDEKRPWCSKCRAHTLCERFQRTSSATSVLRCNRCEGEMLEIAVGLGHSSRLGCIVPGWRVIAAVLLGCRCASSGKEPEFSDSDFSDAEG